METLISQLGSPEFAQRESATLSLTEIGSPALSYLEAASEHPDLEVRTRAKMIYQEVYQGWFEDQSQRFINGDKTVTAFPAWPIVERLTEDSEGMRRLFISISRRHPELVEALEKPIAFQVAAGEFVADQSLQRQFSLFEPTLDDVAAMLIISSENPKSFSDSFNIRLKSLMQHHAFSDAMKNSLAKPLKKLAHTWVIGSPMSIRSDVLSLTLQQRWDVGAVLARNTLGPQPTENLVNPEAIHNAVIVMLEFGNGDDIRVLLPLPDDQREMFRSPVESSPIDGKPTEKSEATTQVRDLIMAAVFRLCEVNMQEAGFPFAKPHSRMFDLEAMAFPDSKPELREKVRTELDKLLKARGQT